MGKTYSPKETARRARKRLGEQNYNANNNNCEHFARECKTGKHKADQSFDAIDIIGAPIWLMAAAADEIFGK